MGMTKKVNKVKLKTIEPDPVPEVKKQNTPAPQPGPWIKMRTGLYVIAAASILMAVLTAWQYIEGGAGWADSIVYGLIYGVMIWAVFFISQVVFRWLRR
jgi:hypothetical protein